MDSIGGVKHITFKTKNYYDESCAVYKAISRLKDFIGESGVFVREFPFIEKIVDFRDGRESYCGKFRISVGV